MITLQALSQFLDHLLSPSSFGDYCPNGLQVEGKERIDTVAFAVSASIAAIDAALKMDADALIVHHGIFWDKEPLSVVGSKKEKLSRLLKGNLSLFAYHLPLDAHLEVGNNWKAAVDLGWQNLHPFGKMGRAAIGVKGEFMPKQVGEFQKQLEAYYRHPASVALGGPAEVKTAALVSGGAHRAIQEAADEGVDCFITGSFDEPIWDIAHERKVNFFALGHYATERIGVLALSELISRTFDIRCPFIDLPNPF
ncbi:MAG: Nif3-like dinuclear metal center hexameric protein [Rhabdochlamydiaceae bacterium]|nr:Nif3-like dinuclear metal center hexameric protein [Rhabdochlamydiaceae bacterium]